MGSVQKLSSFRMQGGFVCLLLLGVLVQHSASKSIEAVECSGPAACPHSCFEQKHYCEFCVTPDMAAAHCAGREAYTKQNTVFGVISRFEQRDDGWAEKKLSSVKHAPTTMTSKTGISTIGSLCAAKVSTLQWQWMSHIILNRAEKTYMEGPIVSSICLIQVNSQYTHQFI